MTNQEKKQYLQRYQVIDKEINRMCEELSQWRAKATKITPTMSDMPKANGGENKLQGAVEKIVEIEKEINIKINELVKVRYEVLQAIDTVENVTRRRLLKYLYINGLTGKEAADEMHYGLRHITRLHKKSISEIKMSSNVIPHL